MTGTMTRFPEINFTASGFSQRFLTVCAFFVFVSFLVFFLGESAHYEKQEKKKKKKQKNMK